MFARRIDQVVLVIVFLLLGIGVVQVYSSSYVYATETRGDGLFFFKRQLLFAALGFATALTVAMVSWRWWQRLIPVVWLAVTACILATLVPGLSITAGGAARWLRLAPGFQFEPSEFLKVTLPLYLAWALSLKNPKIQLLALIGWAVPVVALLRQPDFGAFAICLLVTLGLLFANGLRWRWVIASIAIAIPLFFKLVMEVPYRKARVLAFLDPWSDPDAKGFQVIQSLLSFHAGGFWGVGIGQGQGKLFFLPESHTDFTLAVLGEEAGFLGFFVVMALFGFLMFRGFQIAYKSRDHRSMLSALGIALMLSLAAFINAGVALGLLPTKGLAMPFISYGGSSVIAMSVAIGWLLSIERGEQV